MYMILCNLGEKHTANDFERSTIKNPGRSDFRRESIMTKLNRHQATHATLENLWELLL